MFNTYLGVDISHGTVTWLKVCRRHQRWRVLSAVSNVVDQETCSLLTKVARGATISLAISVDNVSQKIIRLSPKINRKNIMMHLKESSLDYFSMTPDDLLIDFNIISKNQDYLEILACGCKRENIQEQTEFLAKLGLKPTIIDINCYAIWRNIYFYHHDIPPNTVIAVIRTYANTLQFMLIKNHILLFFRETDYSTALSTIKSWILAFLANSEHETIGQYYLLASHHSASAIELKNLLDCELINLDTINLDSTTLDQGRFAVAWGLCLRGFSHDSH